MNCPRTGKHLFSRHAAISVLSIRAFTGFQVERAAVFAKAGVTGCATNVELQAATPMKESEGERCMLAVHDAY